LAAEREDRRLDQLEVEEQTGEGVAVLEAIGDTCEGQWIITIHPQA
jgi:hypothetical protein